MSKRMLNLPLHFSLLGMLAALTVFGCSDDTYVATNELLDDAGTAGSGGGGFAGSAGSAGTAGSAGSGTGGASGAGTGGTTGACTPGQKQDVGSCAKCGTKRQTCDASGQWGPEQCEDQGACNPGDEDTAACSDTCEAKTCKNDCSWGACGLKSGAKCKYNSGSEWQCCGTNKWQFCNSATCDWHPCADCGASSSCQNAC
ncbi:MAG TPA: hypothetical protein PKA88_34160 [Polyangiaceae bacterium]|nr:hypothetical protein [Polyangiaceae bacterium]HMR74868.1 hypothetical protein [Polyangiaceae bacterium]